MMVRGRPLRRRRLKIVRLSFALICVVGASLLLPVVAALLLRMMRSQSLCAEVNNVDAGRRKVTAPLCLQQGSYVTVNAMMARVVGNNMRILVWS